MNETSALLTRHKLTVRDYGRMADAGILAEDDRVELIDGEIIDMAPIGVGHASAVLRISRALFVACGSRAFVSVQNPIKLDDLNEPQPDFAVLKFRDDFYATRLPGPDDILLLVEVGNTSLHYDRAVKLPMYARAGIPEVWIVDLQSGAMTSYSAPSGERFSREHAHQRNDTLHLTAASDIGVRVGELLGEPQPDI